MIFENGYPKIQGSTDLEDSSHLAGILALTDHPQAVDMRLYVSDNQEHWMAPIQVNADSRYIRCPSAKNDCSRDQAILIMCGLLKQGHNDFVRTKLIAGKDFIPPSVHGIEAIAKGQKPSWIQRQWFEHELKFDGESIEEPFQNMSKAMAYNQLKLWTEVNPKWDVAVLNYLRGGRNKWRNEPQLAEFVISKIESLIK